MWRADALGSAEEIEWCMKNWKGIDREAKKRNSVS